MNKIHQSSNTKQSRKADGISTIPRLTFPFQKKSNVKKLKVPLERSLTSVQPQRHLHNPNLQDHLISKLYPRKFNNFFYYKRVSL